MAIIKNLNPSTTPRSSLMTSVSALRQAIQNLQAVVDYNGEFTDAQISTFYDIDPTDVTTFRNLCGGALTAITNANLTNFVKRIVP